MPGIASISVRVSTMVPVACISLMSDPAQKAFARAAQQQHRYGGILGGFTPDAAQFPLRGHVQRIHALRAIDDDLVNAAVERTVVDTHAGLYA